MSIWDYISQKGQELLTLAASKLQFTLSDEPVPESWHAILEERVPLANQLDPAEREHLLRVARFLLEDVPFEGCGDLEMTEEIRVTIAATAALLIHRLPYPRYTKLVRVLVYPDTFVPVTGWSRNEMVVQDVDPTLGQAWTNGVVVLSWSRVMDDALNRGSRGSVVIHEMAHILDAEDGIFDGTPLLPAPGRGAAWAEVLDREFDLLVEAVESGGKAPLDAYGAKNHAEFFAVASESYFCTPDRLRSRIPDLYRELQLFYR